ncbi:MAG TPA: ABC transporter permease [Actinomycetota bacterium]|nr:ABC transporter permease [Actinomycetota bacterium]
MSGLGMVLRQVRFVNKAFWRNPPAAFFTFAFPLFFLVIFTTLFGSADITINGHEVTVATFYVAGIAAFSVITACYTNIAMSLSFARDLGILKRIKGTPLPGWAYLAAKMLHSVAVAILLVLICLVFGMLLYDVRIPLSSIPALVVSLAFGAACFSALGMAVTTIVPNADAAPAIVNASILPLLFVSDVFIPMQDPPAWIDTIGNLFPIRHFSEALQRAFFPPAGGSAFSAMDLAVLAAWGAVGLLVAVRRFSWEPRR